MTLRSRGVGICVALSLSPGWIGAANAGVDVEPVHVVYDADPKCPGRTKFVEEVMARTPKISMAEASRAKRTFVVTVRATESGFVGRLEIQAGDPTATTREINGQSCPAVVSAVALVAALAVDPESLRGDAPGAAAGPPHEKSPPTTPTANPPAGQPPSSASPNPEPRKSRDWHWAIGAKAETNSFIAPELSLGGGAFVELAPSDDGSSALEGSLGLEAVRLAAHYAVSGSASEPAGTAHFDWGALSLEGCPFRLRGGSARIDACAAFHAGFLRGHGDQVSGPQSSFEPGQPLRGWVSAAPLLRVKWTFFGSWFVDAEGALVIPLRRDKFIFEQTSPLNSSVFYEVPTLGAAAGIGIGYRFDDRERNRRP